MSGCSTVEIQPFTFKEVLNSSEWRIPKNLYNSSNHNVNKTILDFRYIAHNWEKYYECLYDFDDGQHDDRYKSLCNQAATYGSIHHQRKLAFEYGSKKQDILKSIEWYESAVLGGDRIAMNNLGLIYASHHKLVRRNIKLAVELLENSGGYLGHHARNILRELKVELGTKP